MRSTKKLYERNKVKNKVKYWLKNSYISLQSLTRYKSQGTNYNHGTKTRGQRRRVLLGKTSYEFSDLLTENNLH